MRRHQDIERLLSAAETARRCAFASTRAQGMALSRRRAVGELHSPYPSLFVRPEYWTSLAAPEKTLHIARALHLRHDDWVFAGTVAAAAHQLEHQWFIHDGTITVATGSHGDRSRGQLRQLFAPGVTGEMVSGVRVTSLARTVVDCAVLLDFRTALPIADSALARGVSTDAVLAACDVKRRDRSGLFRLLHYANPVSENGGESFARGTLLEAGFEAPQLQTEFVDPSTGGRYRADFAWRLPDGRLIVGEFDGQGKYVDPQMAAGRSVAGVVADERERQEGLRRAGVDTIFRFTFRDAAERVPLVRKAAAAGVPARGAPTNA